MNNKLLAKPIYPYFKQVSLSNKATIESLTKEFSPYCDFNFATIFTWSSSKKPSEFTTLNDNLVLKIKDYYGERELVSFIGKNKVEKTIDTLLSSYDCLSFVPEECLSRSIMNKTKYLISEDIKNTDYIYSLSDIAKLTDGVYKSKRHWVSKFLRLCPQARIEILDLSNPNVVTSILGVFEKWRVFKKKNETEVFDERSSLKRILDFHNNFNVLGVGVYDNDALIGFSLNELSGRQVAFGGFAKNDYSYPGIVPFLERETSKILLDKGYKLISWEQDLGEIGLRKSKLSWHPSILLKKYKISRKH